MITSPTPSPIGDDRLVDPPQSLRPSISSARRRVAASIPIAVFLMIPAVRGFSVDGWDVSLRAGFEHPDDSYRARANRDGYSVGEFLSDAPPRVVPAVSIESSGHWATDDRIVVGAIVSHRWFAFGASAYYRSSRDDTTALVVGGDTGGRAEESLTLRAKRFGLIAEGGAVLPLGRWVHVEMLPYVSAGSGNLDMRTRSLSVDADIDVIEVGAHADLVVQPVDHWQIGIGLGYSSSQSEVNDDSIREHATVREHGLSWRGFVGMRF